MNFARTLAVAASAIALLSAAAAQATTSIPYPNSGHLNPTTYTFTATATGDIVGYFAGSGAGWDEQVALMVNGVAPSASAFGLDDHATPVGGAFDFGHVTAGDSLVFVLRANGNYGKFAYSDPKMNGPYDSLPVGTNHIYSTLYTDGSLGHAIPKGVYVAFEDLPTTWSDHNYFDDTFVFTNVGTQATYGGASGVPEPASWALMILGIGGIGAALRSRRARTLALQAG